MAHPSKEKDALLAAKQDLLSAYSTVHSSLGRLISLVNNSEPRAVADALGSDYEQHLIQSSPQDAYPRGSTASQANYNGSRPPHYSEPQTYRHHHYPAPPQPPPSSNPRTSAPPGPCFVTVTPGAPRQLSHNNTAVQAPKPRQRKPQLPPANQAYASQPTQPLETDDEEDDEDDPEEPVSEDDHINGTNNSFYAPPRQPTTIPTPPGSIPGGKKKRGKRERDPNAPKRPASAYILFQNAVRQEMRAANPSADYKELARQIGDRWKNLSEEDKRPWSEAGKLAMNSWNIQNKEYKISHPDVTSPHNQQTIAAQAPVGRKKRNRTVEVDAQGNPFPKKRGRPSKNEKDQPVDHNLHPVHHDAQHLPPNRGMPPRPINGHAAPPAPAPAHIASVPQQVIQRPPHQEEEYSEEGEEEEEEEEEEEVEEEEEEAEEAPKNYPPARPADAAPSLLPAARINGASQVPSHMAAPAAPHSESELEEGEEDEGSEARSPDPHHHSVNKLVNGH